MIPDAIRPALARIIGAAAAALSVWVMKHFGHELSPDLQSAFGDIGVFVAFAVYASVHKAVSVKTNPTDAASPVLAAVATGPLGGGQRTALATTLEQAATAPAEPPQEGG